MNRHLTVRTATYVVVASMVGSGILTTSGFILQSTQSHWLNLLLWAVGGAVALAGALTLSEMSTAFPRSGGDYIYVREALGDAWGFVYGWSCLLIGYAAPIALIAYTTGNYFYQPLVAVLRELGIISELPLDTRSFNLVFATIAIVALSIQHARSHANSSAVQEWTTIFKLLIFAVMLVLGAVYLPDQVGLNFMPPEEARGVAPTALALGLVQVMYAYTGWNAAVYIASEIPEPRRNVPLALLRGTVLVALLYIALNILYALALPLETVLALGPDETGRIAAIAIERLAGALTGNIISSLLSLGMLASLSAFIMVGPRIAYAMAQDRLIHPRLGRLHDRNHLPVAAIVFQCVLSLVLLWSGTFEQLLNFAGFGLGVLALISVGTIFVLRRRGGYAPTLRVPGYPWVPLIFSGVSLYMLFGSMQAAPVQALTGIGALLVGFPIYHLSVGRKRVRG